MPNPFTTAFTPPQMVGSDATPAAAAARVGSPFDEVFAPDALVGSGAPSAPAFDVPAMATTPIAAPPPTMPAFMPPPAAPGARPDFLTMALPIIASTLIGRKDPRAMAAGLAAFMQGRDLKRAERESVEERDTRRRQEQADFYSRATTQAQTFDDPVAFEQWKHAIAPVAQVHGIDPSVFTFNDQKLATRTKKEAADLLDVLDKQHPDGNYTVDWKDPKTGTTRRITRAELARLAGTVAFDAQGQPLAPVAAAFKPTTPDEMKIDAFARSKGKRVQDLTPAEIQEAVGTGKAASEPRKYEVTVPGRNGRPVKKLVTEEELAQGVEQYEKPEKTSTGNSDLVQAVLDNPELYDRLTAKQIGDIAPALNAAGFKGFGKAMNESAITKIAESKSAIASLRDLRTTLQENEQYIGPIAGLSALNPYSDARKAQAKIDLVKQRVGKALEGGVLRKEDEEKYKKILATLRDEPSTAIYKVDQIIATLERDLDTFIESQRGAGRRVAPNAKDPMGLFD